MKRLLQWNQVLRPCLSGALGILCIAPQSGAGRSEIAPRSPPASVRSASDDCGQAISLGQLQLALEACNRSLSSNPFDAKALSNRGVVYLLSGRAQEASADFNAAAALRPLDANLHYNRGLALARLADRQAAILAFTEAIRINPSFAPAYHNRGVEYELSRDLGRARSDYEKALAVDPQLQKSRTRLRNLGWGVVDPKGAE